jgi:hypothetical protein
MPDREILYLAGHLPMQGKTHKYLVLRKNEEESI